MTDRTCSIDGCGKPRYAKGWCSMHHQRWKRNGDPIDPGSRIVGDTEARFWSYVDRGSADDCWNWTGGTSPDGYGVLRVARQTAYMPRYSYELVHGPITAGLEPDHLCRNRLCVNPAHLEPVTHRENVLRGESPQAINARKTHCSRGHEFTEANTYVTPSTGGRNCRTCLALHEAKRRAPRLGPAPTTRRRQAA